MSKFVIEGGNTLQGEINIQGAKNAALPVLASSLLSEQECIFDNVPRISDVMIMIELLSSLGATVDWLGPNRLSICARDVQNKPLDYSLVRRLRASVLLVGPLLARFGEAQLPFPGGCLLGKRPLDVHFQGFEKLGAEVIRENEHFNVRMKHKQGGKIFLSEASVTATENILMAAALQGQQVIIRNAACEPHVENLADILTAMGVAIQGKGTNTVYINGLDSSKELKAVEAKVIPDQLEVGSFAAAAIVTKGEVTLTGVDPDHLDPILLKFDEANVSYRLQGDRLQLLPSPKLRHFNLTTNVWPGFPTDLQAPFTVIATQSHGNSMIHDWMYEGRLFYIDKLIAMGAEITLCDPHRIIVSGPTLLHGKQIESPDIRAGMALVVAAVCAQGESVIDRVELIDRGYLDVEGRLGAVGASIRRVD